MSAEQPSDRRPATGLAGLALLTAALLVGGCAATPQAPSNREIFVFESRTTLPAGASARAPVQLWIPVPSGNGYQDVSLLEATLQPAATWGALTAEADEELLHERVDPRHGNTMLHALVPQGDHPEMSIVLRWRVERRSRPSGPDRPDGSGVQEAAGALLPDRLVPLDGEVALLAGAVPAGEDDLQTGRALFEAVRAAMQYDKTEPGWGQGDALRACRIGKGNCTDFHALFIGMARAKGLPARFTIGHSLPLPVEGSSPEPVAGYHCWAEFFAEGVGWVPVDISEADQHPERAELYFGRLTPDRIAISSGRDIELDPVQSGPPLNYFIDPYGEREGEVLDAIGYEVSVSKD